MAHESRWHLRAAAVTTIWEGPVVRAHVKPYDIKLWDEIKKAERQQPRQEIDPAKPYIRWAGQQFRKHDTLHVPALDDKHEENRIRAEQSFTVGGIHAVFDRKAAENVADDYSAPVFGMIHIWGRIARFKRGYRAEICMVKELFIMRTHFFALRCKEVKEDFEDIYQCPVHIV